MQHNNGNGNRATTKNGAGGSIPFIPWLGKGLLAARVFFLAWHPPPPPPELSVSRRLQRSRVKGGKSQKVEGEEESRRGEVFDSFARLVYKFPFDFLSTVFLC